MVKIVSFLVILVTLGCSTVSYRNENIARSISSKTTDQFVIKGISVAYIHTYNKELANWYEKTLGLKKGLGFPTWQEFEMEQGSRFALDFISYPSSAMQRQPVVISFEVDDIFIAVKELTAKGVRFYPDNDLKQAIFQAGSNLIATFEDPDGNFMQLVQSGTEE